MTKTTTVQQADRAVIVTDTAVDEEDDCSEECCPICYESYTPVWRLPPPLPSSSSSDAVALAIDYGRPSSTRYVDDGNDTSTALDDNNDDDDDDVNTNRNNSTTTSRTVSLSSSSSSFDEENCIIVAMEKDQQRTTIDLDDDLDLEIGAPPSRRRPHPNEKVRIPGCQHTFCRDCLQNHCVYTIGLHKVPIRCPALGCSSLLPVGLIRDSIVVLDKNEHDTDHDTDHDTGDHEKQEQEQNQAEDSNDGSSNDSNYWIKFQRLHQIYLENKNNLLHQQQQQQQQHVNTTTHTGGHRESDRDANVKPCSHCSVPIYKEAGCDHIVCPRCDQDMCFKCGTHMYLTGRLGNDNASMIRECLKCQQSFVDHRHRRAYRCLLILLLPVCLPICIIYASMAALLAVGTGGCCCCLGCGIRIQPRQPRPRSTMVPKKKKKKKRSNTVSANNNNHNTNDEQNSNNSNSNTINCGYVRKGTAAGTLSSSSSVTRNNDTNNNSIHSTTGTTTTTRTTRKKRNTRSVRWMPVVAIQRVLGFIFLPFLDLFFQLGITDKCCPGSNCGEFTKHVSLKYLFCFWKEDDEDENECEIGCDDEECDYEYEYTGDDEYGCTDDDEETN